MENKCTTCGTENSPEAKHCITCGLGLSTEIKKQKTDKPKRSWVKKTGMFVVLATIIIAIMLAPTTVTVPYQKTETYQEDFSTSENYDIQVPYETQETYVESVPYDTIEYFTESEPYTYRTQVQYAVVDAYYNNYILSPPSSMWVTITNGDGQSGYFSVQFDITTIGGATKVVTASAYLLPQETKAITATTNDQIQTYNYKVTPPQKEVSGYHDVQKTRTVTKHQDVQRTRTVTKVRTDTAQRTVIKQRPAQRVVTDYRQQSVMTYQKILGWY